MSVQTHRNLGGSPGKETIEVPSTAVGGPHHVKVYVSEPSFKVGDQQTCCKRLPAAAGLFA